MQWPWRRYNSSGNNKKISEKKEKIDKTKTVAEIDRDKLEKKFSPKKDVKSN